MIHQGGYYLHYKNKLYRAVGVAKHSETLEELVVYEPQYGEGAYGCALWTCFWKMLSQKGKKCLDFVM